MTEKRVLPERKYYTLKITTNNAHDLCSSSSVSSVSYMSLQLRQKAIRAVFVSGI